MDVLVRSELQFFHSPLKRSRRDLNRAWGLRFAPIGIAATPDWFVPLGISDYRKFEPSRMGAVSISVKDFTTF